MAVVRFLAFKPLLKTFEGSLHATQPHRIDLPPPRWTLMDVSPQIDASTRRKQRREASPPRRNNNEMNNGK